MAQVDGHTVKWYTEHKFKELFNFSCTCSAYKTDHGYCKHIKKVCDQRCGWIGLIDDQKAETINGKLVCPRCKEQVLPVGYGD